MPLIPCPTCDAQISTNATACPKCGEPLTKEARAAGMAEATALEPGPESSSELPPEPSPQPSSKPRSKLRYFGWALGGLVGLVVIGVVGILIDVESDRKKTAARLDSVFRVTAPSLNQRSCAADTCDVVTVSSKGIAFRVFETQGEWSRISFAGDKQQRWVSSAFLAPVEFGTVKNIRYKDGEFFGAVKDGKPHGFGVFLFSNGNRYEGEWREGDRTGLGVRFGLNRLYYEGSFLDGRYHGAGKLRYSNGDRYEGEFVDNVPHGTGTLTSANGDRYEGEFVDKIPHGTGTFTSASGKFYKGRFLNGKPDPGGKGTTNVASARGGSDKGTRLNDRKNDGPLEDGLAAYNSGDYATAIALWRPLADQGVALAQYRLGDMYGTSKGVPENQAEAAKWYRKAADQGFAVAQFNIGIAYDTGKGVPENKAEAVKWYRKAADQGIALARLNLGIAYATAQGVPGNNVRAYVWLNLAAAQGLESAKRAIAMVEKNMTREQIAEAQRLSTDLKIIGIIGKRD